MPGWILLPPVIGRRAGSNPVAGKVSCYDIPDVDIAPSARKHQARDGFDDDDIRHAVVFALYAAEDGDDLDKAIYLGPDRAARFLEVVVVVRSDGSEVVIHAMKMRKGYEVLLPGGVGE